MSWTDERVETLKRLWGEGHSASQIAGQLGGVSRNAVIGKVHRLGLESRLKKDAPAKEAAEASSGGAGDAPAGTASAGTAPANAPVTSAEASAGAEAGEPAPAASGPEPGEATPGSDGGAPPTPANDPGTPVAGAVNGATNGAANGAAAPNGAASDEGEEAVAPVPLELKLTQLTERTCKWPIGDPMHDDFHFCGHEAEESRPYCEYHSGLAFQPASERRRVR